MDRADSTPVDGGTPTRPTGGPELAGALFPAAIPRAYDAAARDTEREPVVPPVIA